MDGFQPFRRNMGVNLRGGNVGVTQHDLDDTQIRATFKQMTGKRVAQCVGTDRVPDTCLSGIFL